MENIILFSNGSHGVYIPQYFAESVKREYVEGVDSEEWAILENGPDNEDYWDVWDSVLNKASLEMGGKIYSLYQDGDLWLIDYENLTIEEELNMFGESERFDNEMELIRDQWPDVKGYIVEQYGNDDIPAIDQGFNDWTDSLCKNGYISEYTYDKVTREEIEN